MRLVSWSDASGSSSESDSGSMSTMNGLNGLFENSRFKIIWKAYGSSACTGGVTASPYVNTMTHSGFSESYEIELFNYKNNADCSWLLAPMSSSVIDEIHLDFGDFHSEQCCDFLEVYDVTHNETLYTTISGNYSSSLTIRSSVVRLHFRSDSSVTGGGFKLWWRAYSDPACNGGKIQDPWVTLSSSTGLSEPNEIGILDYGNNYYCTWLLLPSSNSRIDGIIIDFIEFDTEQCCDYLEVHDVASNGTQYIKINGSDLSSLTIPSTQVRLFFRSDSSVQGRGFKLQWRAFGVFSCAGSNDGVFDGFYFRSTNILDLTRHLYLNDNLLFEASEEFQGSTFHGSTGDMHHAVGVDEDFNIKMLRPRKIITFLEPHDGGMNYPDTFAISNSSGCLYENCLTVVWKVHGVEELFQLVSVDTTHDVVSDLPCYSGIGSMSDSRVTIHSLQYGEIDAIFTYKNLHSGATMVIHIYADVSYHDVLYSSVTADSSDGQWSTSFDVQPHSSSHEICINVFHTVMH